MYGVPKTTAMLWLSGLSFPPPSHLLRDAPRAIQIHQIPRQRSAEGNRGRLVVVVVLDGGAVDGRVVAAALGIHRRPGQAAAVPIGVIGLCGAKGAAGGIGQRSA